MKRGVLGSEVIKAIRNCPIDPAFVAELVDGKLTLTLDDPEFEQLGDEIWSQGVDLEDEEQEEAEEPAKATKIEAINPRWIGEYPAWDIMVDGKIVKEGVTSQDIQVALIKLKSKGLIHHYDSYIDTIRHYHIELYVKALQLHERGLLTS